MLERLYHLWFFHPSENYPNRSEDFVDDTYNVIYFGSAALNLWCSFFNPEPVLLNMMLDKLRSWKLTNAQRYLFYNSIFYLCCLLSSNGFFPIQSQSTKLNLRRSLYSKNITHVRIPSSPCWNISTLLSCMAVLKSLIPLFFKIMVSMCWESKREREKNQSF